MSRILKVMVFGAVFVSLVAWSWGGKYESVKAVNGEVKIAVSDLKDGKAHFYTIKAGGKTVNFFVMKSSDGIIRAAFDACDVCYREKKGYREEGDYMVCNNCGQRFPSRKINEVKGGCNPSPLNRTIVGNNVVLKVNDIQSGAFYF